MKLKKRSKISKVITVQLNDIGLHGITVVRLCSNQIEFICDTKQNINECDIIIRQMCRQDTKAAPPALTGALTKPIVDVSYGCSGNGVQ